MKLRHYLQPLVTPTSVALVGASERPGSVGRIVFENLLAGGYKGELIAVNPHHRHILGQPVVRSLAAVDKRLDLAVIVTPCDQVADVLAQGGARGLRAAVVITSPPVGAGAGRQWSRDVAAVAAKHGVRFVGPEAFGIIRTDQGLNATIGSVQALPGRLALIAQSGSVCSALLDFATPAGIGFSSVMAVGDALDVTFGEMLDALLLDPTTDAIVLCVEKLRDPRRFLSALRAAARTKPVVVLKSGRAMQAVSAHRRKGAPDEDTVFEAALKRAGTVRVWTYSQLFAAARILTMSRKFRGERLAIVGNGRGPGLMGADSAVDNGLRLAEFAAETIHALEAQLPPESVCGNPLDVGGTASPQLFAKGLATVLADPNTDAVLALHTPLPAAPATDTARAAAEVARASPKLVLAAWLGAVQKPEARKALEAGGIASFYTPETAIEGFSFLASYNRNQKWLLEVPPSQPEPEALDLDAAERIRKRALVEDRTVLTDAEAQTLLAAFGLPSLPTLLAGSRAAAVAAARRIGFPVALKLESQIVRRPNRVARSRLNLRTSAIVERTYDALLAEARERTGAPWKHGVVVQKMVALPDAREVSIGVYTDAVFGPVIAFGNGGIQAVVEWEKAVMLPPLNRALALDLIGGTRTAKYLGAFREYPAADIEPLVRMLLQLSTLICALPWIRELELNPVQVTASGAAVVDARIVIDPKAANRPDDYRHMAIHPYPMELVSDVTLRDGSVLHVRPIRPEDAELERAFVAGLSEETRFFRFFYRLQELTPGMLARFTQIDYDREMALIALHDIGETKAIVGVARYITNPDRESAEFAVTTADEWHGRGVGRMLMKRLLAVAKQRGLKRLEGAVLRANHNMLRFTAALGFVAHDDPDDHEQVICVNELD